MTVTSWPGVRAPRAHALLAWSRTSTRSATAATINGARRRGIPAILPGVSRAGLVFRRRVGRGARTLAVGTRGVARLGAALGRLQRLRGAVARLRDGGAG